jgi:hypothetical protein
MMNDTIQLPNVIVGEVVDIDDAGQPRVSWSDGGPVSALTVWMPSVASWAGCLGKRVVLGFVEGDESRPVVLGLLDAPPSVDAAPPTGDPARLHLRSRRELVIECGESSISLRNDGRIEIRGTHLISRSSGPNKIKGGVVLIN